MFRFPTIDDAADDHRRARALPPEILHLPNPSFKPSTPIAGTMAPGVHARLEVRPLLVQEASQVVRYFLEASPADLERMGVDRSRLAPANEWTRRLEETVRHPPGQSFYLAWLVDGEAVGFSSLKNLQVGKQADIHLHVWSPRHRGHGQGAILFCRSVVDAYDRFLLQRLVCEPKASNPMPNRMLARIGFPLVETYVGASSDLSETTTLNRYAIDRAVAESYLSQHV